VAATVEIPADKGEYGSFDSTPADPDAQKIAMLYASFIDEGKLEELGIKPIAGELAKIDAITDKKQIPALIARFNQLGISEPYTPDVHQDARNPTKYVVDLGQSGLGLPDRDYYLKDDDKLKRVRAEYRSHIEKVTKLAGNSNTAKDANDILVTSGQPAREQVAGLRLANEGCGVPAERQPVVLLCLTTFDAASMGFSVRSMSPTRPSRKRPFSQRSGRHRIQVARPACTLIHFWRTRLPSLAAGGSNKMGR